MKAKNILVLGLLALAAASPMAGYYCSSWMKISEDEKYGWVTGYWDGLISNVDIHRLVDLLPPGGIIQDDQIKGIDAICSQPKNAVISSGEALTAFVKKAKGAPQSEIDGFLNKARQDAIKFQDSLKSNK
jgi:hypothetical protein